MELAAVGKVKAHHDRANLSLINLLYEKSISAAKNTFILSSIAAKASNRSVNFMYPKNAIAGGASVMTSVGTNLSANLSQKTNL